MGLVFLQLLFSLLVLYSCVAFQFPLNNNENEFSIACQNEQKKIPELIEFWKQKDKEISDANEKLEKEYQDRIVAFYKGELSTYPGQMGPVGIDMHVHIGRGIVHHVAKYYDSNHKKELEFDVFPDGECKRK